MITHNFNQTSVSTAERTQSDHLGRTLPLVGAYYPALAAPFDGGCVS